MIAPVIYLYLTAILCFFIDAKLALVVVQDPLPTQTPFLRAVIVGILASTLAKVWWYTCFILAKVIATVITHLW